MGAPSYYSAASQMTQPSYFAPSEMNTVPSFYNAPPSALSTRSYASPSTVTAQSSYYAPSAISMRTADYAPSAISTRTADYAPSAISTRTADYAPSAISTRTAEYAPSAISTRSAEYAPSTISIRTADYAPSAISTRTAEYAPSAISTRTAEYAPSTITIRTADYAPSAISTRSAISAAPTVSRFSRVPAKQICTKKCYNPLCHCPCRDLPYRSAKKTHSKSTRLVLDISNRSVLIWSTKDWNQNDHKSLRVNIEFDYAAMVRWSPDSKAFVIHKASENAIEVYKIAKKADGSLGNITKASTFPKHHNEDVVGLDIAANGRFIMTCSSSEDLVLWDLKGEKLAVIQTLVVTTYRARVSPCGRFVAASGFTSDVKVWQVIFSKAGEFDRVSRAFDLKGHTSGVYDFAFNADSTRMVTVSKDGTWKLFNVNVEHEKGEEPRLLQTSVHEDSSVRSSIALSPDGEVVAIATGLNIYIYAAHSGQLHQKIADVYSSGVITSLRFDSTGHFLLSAGNRHVRVFHNVTGAVVDVMNCEAKLKKSGLSAAMKERLSSSIKESRNFAAKFGEKC